tara:strand:+ start:524 stop:775 length:252 start_codon:yes stop_codon:yes gene_type:complete
MGLDPSLFNYLIGLNTHALSSDNIAELLSENGFVNPTGELYSVKQVSSILHSVRTIKRARDYRPINRCGIDRDGNPCGDASEY